MLFWHVLFLISLHAYYILFSKKEWCAEYSQRKPRIKDLQGEIDNFMQDFDAKIEEVSSKIIKSIH